MKSGEVVVFDKAYVDFKHLGKLNSRGVFWVTRAKESMVYGVMGQHVSGKSAASLVDAQTEDAEIERKRTLTGSPEVMGQHVCPESGNTGVRNAESSPMNALSLPEHRRRSITNTPFA